MALVSYEKEGKFDYDTYREIQIIGNARKIDKVFADEAMVRRIAAFALDHVKPLQFILCHGTRNGAEQAFFRRAVPCAVVLGTDIADGAEAFPDTIQWDFHETKPEWHDAVDLL